MTVCASAPWIARPHCARPDGWSDGDEPEGRCRLSYGKACALAPSTWPAPTYKPPCKGRPLEDVSFNEAMSLDLEAWDAYVDDQMTNFPCDTGDEEIMIGLEDHALPGCPALEEHRKRTGRWWRLGTCTQEAPEAGEQCIHVPSAFLQEVWKIMDRVQESRRYPTYDPASLYVVRFRGLPADRAR